MLLQVLSKIGLSLFLIVCSLNNVFANTANVNKPNIVLVMADDIGVGDIGFYHRLRTGKDPIVPTPNLDELVNQGMRFSDAHSPASLCAPSRFSMLTGNYPVRSGKINGVWHPHSNSGIEPKSTTSGRIAKSAGYNTAFFGKWGLGESWTKKIHGYEKLERGALYFGFDYSLELPDGIQNSPLAFYENKEFMPLKADSTMKEIPLKQTQFTGKGGRNIASVMMGDSNWNPTMAGPVLAHKAVEYIERQSKLANKKPFFMYYSTQAVHIPHTPPVELDGVKIKGATPNVYGDMIVELDTQVGMLVKALKKAGTYDNTLFVFTSDNGGLGSKYGQAMIEAGHLTSNGLREVKGSIYEGGHRVPFVAVWPGKIAPKSESNTLIVGHDIVATIADIVGEKVERNVVKDSLSLLPIFKNKPLKQKHAYITHQSKFGPYMGIRQGDWKLIMSTPNVNDIANLKPYALFNLKENVSENEAGNLVNDPKQAQRIKELLALYIEHRKVGAPTVVDTI